MKKTNTDAFYFAGISIRTTNENAQSATDIPALWEKFMTTGVMNLIPNKADNNLYCIYTDYEKDHTRPYTTIIGCKVSSLEHLPDGLTGRSFAVTESVVFIAKGNIKEGSVFNTWTQIWNSDLNRAYTTDVEVYGEKAQDMENAEVDIFIAVK